MNNYEERSLHRLDLKISADFLSKVLGRPTGASLLIQASYCLLCLSQVSLDNTTTQADKSNEISVQHSAGNLDLK